MGGSVWFSGVRCANANSYYFDHHGERPPTYARARLARRGARTRSFPLDDYRYATLARHGADPAEKESVTA